MPSFQRKFRRHLDSLAMVFDLIDQFALEENVDDDAKHAVALALDELFTNTVKYHPTNPNDITIDLRAEGETMVVRLIDRDVDPFDLTKKPDPDIGGALGDRKPGGLGVFLTKSVVDDLHYSYDDRTSTITLRKGFRRKHV